MTPTALGALVNIAEVHKEINALEADIATAHRYALEALARYERKGNV
jgi:hypothetical protein